MTGGFFIRIFSINECWTKWMTSSITHRIESIIKMWADADSKIITLFFLMDLISLVEQWLWWVFLITQC